MISSELGPPFIPFWIWYTSQDISLIWTDLLKSFYVNAYYVFPKSNLYKYVLLLKMLVIL